MYFPKSMYFEIKLCARRENKATAEWIRDAVAVSLEKQRKVRSKKRSKLKTFSYPQFRNFKPEDIDKIVYDL